MTWKGSKPEAFICSPSLSGIGPAKVSKCSPYCANMPSNKKPFSNLGHFSNLDILLIFSGRHSQVENVIFQLYGCQPQNGSDPWAVLDFLELEIYSELHSTLHFFLKIGCSFSTLILKAFISDAFWGHLSTKSQGQNLSLFCSLFNETFFFNSVSSLSAIISHRLLSH